MAEQKENLRVKIEDWLNEQGYPLEMELAESFTTLRDTGQFQIDIIQASVYTDPDSGSGREIDVSVRVTDAYGFLQLFYLCECKRSSRPWVAFTSVNSSWGMPRTTAFAIMNENAKKVGIERVKDFMSVTWFEKNERVAYGLTEAFTRKEDSPYAAAYSAVKASVAELRSQSGDHVPDRYSFIFPIIVVDAPLFESYLNESGELIVEEVESIHLSFRLNYKDCWGTSVRVCRKSALPALMNDIRNIRFELFQLLEPELNKAYDRLIKGDV